MARRRHTGERRPGGVPSHRGGGCYRQGAYAWRPPCRREAQREENSSGGRREAGLCLCRRRGSTTTAVLLLLLLLLVALFEVVVRAGEDVPPFRRRPRPGQERRRVDGCIPAGGEP